MINYAMMNDNIDNHYLESGDQTGGTVYVLSGFMRKIAGAVITGIGGWRLPLAGIFCILYSVRIVLLPLFRF